MIVFTLLVACDTSSVEKVRTPSLDTLRSQWNTNEQKWSDDELLVLHQGQQVYQSHCAVCHLDSGEGQVMMGAPALKGGAIVKGPVHIHRQLVMSGRGDMPGFLEVLNHEEIAAVISYERNAWGNMDGNIVTALKLENITDIDSCELESEPAKSSQHSGNTVD